MTRYTWQIVGISRYRNGDFRGAITALELARSIGISRPQQAENGFFLAMACWRSARELEAKQYLHEAIQAMTNDNANERFDLLLEIRAEAEQALGVREADTDGLRIRDG